MPELSVSQDQILLTLLLVATVSMFLWGRWRHDMVAGGALLACVLVGLVPPGAAFSGFGHPAVITVACVLVLSRGLQNAGAVDALSRTMLPAKAGRAQTVLVLMGLGAFLSAFMNNVGAMALLMPVAIHVSKRLELAAGQVLMPLAFGTMLGGMTTLIGTPPNIIVSGFRADAGLGSFAMFDFSPIGVPVALVGVVFVALLGWRLVPERRDTGVEGFSSGAYITEARVLEESKADGKRLREIESEIRDVDAQILGIVRQDFRLIAANPSERVRSGDILMLEAEAEALPDVLSILGLKLEESVESEAPQAEAPEKEESLDDAATGDDVSLMELVVMPGSPIVGRSARDLLLRTRYRINLLALSRKGERTRKRLRSMPFRSGDLLLMQGATEAVSQFAGDHGCVPLARREFRIAEKRKIWQASLIMLLAVGGAAFGLLPVAISFALGVLLSMVAKTVPPRHVYEAIDWPVIVLLGALIPVASAMQSTGTADLIARLLMDHVAQGNAVVGLAVVLVVTMFLSDLMNNAATAAVMCPIAIGTAATLGVRADAFLMAVAIGASCAFLTPIGHQNNTLILGPGGFRFGDYWRLGLPLEVMVVAMALPMLLFFWPF